MTCERIRVPPPTEREVDRLNLSTKEKEHLKERIRKSNEVKVTP